MNRKDGLRLISMLGELMKSGDAPIFGRDETGAKWRREQNVGLLLEFCPEGYKNAKDYGHFLVGNSQGASYIAIPGRFTRKDQPAYGETGFTLWQPLRGGEEFYENLSEIEELEDEEKNLIYGYWIGEVDPKTLKISEPR